MLIYIFFFIIYLAFASNLLRASHFVKLVAGTVLIVCGKVRSMYVVVLGARNNGSRGPHRVAEHRLRSPAEGAFCWSG